MALDGQMTGFTRAASSMHACRGVRGKNQDLWLSLGWKIRAHQGYIQWQQLLVCLMIRKAKELAAILL
jgi:hypothetical protein